MTIYLIAAGIGTVTMGQVGDYFGRWPVALLTLLGAQIAHTCTIFAPNLSWFLFLRFWDGFFSGSGVISAVLVNELSGQKKRGLAAAIYSTGWGLGILLLANCGYIYSEWKALVKCLTIVTLPLFLVIFTIPESPHWLYTKGKYRKANAVLKRIISGNGFPWREEYAVKNPLPSSKSFRADDGAPPKRKFFLVAFCQSRRVIRAYFVLLCGWFVNFGLYYGLTLLSGKIGDTIYASVALNGVMEIPGDYVGSYISNRLGRKSTVGLFLSTGGLFMTIAALFQPLPYMQVALLALAKFCASASITILTVFTNELLPTMYRTGAFGVLHVSARLGAAFCPHLVMLNEIIHGSAYIVFGGLSFAGASAVVTLLPDTRGKRLPTTVEELHEML